MAAGMAWGMWVHEASEWRCHIPTPTVHPHPILHALRALHTTPTLSRRRTGVERGRDGRSRKGVAAVCDGEVEEEGMLERADEPSAAHRGGKCEGEAEHEPEEGADDHARERLHQHAEAVLAADEPRLGDADGRRLQHDEGGGRHHEGRVAGGDFARARNVGHGGGISTDPR